MSTLKYDNIILGDFMFSRRLRPGGGGTSITNHTGMCASFGWLLARKFSEWDVALKENSEIGV